MGRRNPWIARLLLYLMLEIGALTGVPMRPDEIEAMTRQLNNAVAEERARREDDGSGDPP